MKNAHLLHGWLDATMVYMQQTCGMLLATFYLLIPSALQATPPLHSAPESTGSDSVPPSDHWAWQAVRRVPPSPIKQTSWPCDPVDQYILAELDKNNLSPVIPAIGRRWLRRVTFDLTGLPPSVSDVEKILDHDTPDIRQRQIDRLLSSPRFGEHWGQHWLDLVRYAETHGQEQDEPILNAYRYRDYVIRAFNQNVPYDQFVLEHIAGDLLVSPRIDRATRTNQSVQGTGFWLMTEANHIPIDLRGDEAERRENQVEVFSKTFLALTTNCARCHNHKFDAISSDDYYALCGYLQSSSYQQANVADPIARQQALDQFGQLQSKYAPLILERLAQAIRTSHFPDYIVAAISAIPVKTADRLKQDVLERWTTLLSAAQEDIASPFYPIMQIASNKQLTDSESNQRARQTVKNAWLLRTAETTEKFRSQKTIVTREEGERNYASSERQWTTDDLLLNFTHPGPEDWITSGLRFGNGPTQTGELLWGRDRSTPLAGILVEDAAHSDLYSEKFTGILRTRTFAVSSDTLWYRFRGNAQVFLCVDSYRCGATPGSVHHGKHLFRKLEGDHNYRWQSHRVARYLGHRIHIEFTPETNFSLSRIQFSAAEPPELFQPNRRIAAILEQASTESLEQFAQRYQALFSQATQDLATQYGNRQSGDLRDVAPLVAWVIEHKNLLDLPDKANQDLTNLWQAYTAEKIAIESGIPKPEEAPALLDGSGEDEYVHRRGDHHKLADKATPRRSLAALGGLDQPRPTHGSGRLELAQHFVDPSNPLLARVIVNRVWQHLFSQGLVRSVDNFGVMGAPPSHPELLDYLAADFLQNGWSIKWLIRRLVHSQSYAMSSRPQLAAEHVDPTNRLLHRMALKSLPAESVRDTILYLSGRLDPMLHGPSVPAYYTAFTKAYQIQQASGPQDGAGRRSIYLEVRRNQLLEFLTTFGRPVPLTTVGQRDQSTTANQPLTLLNDPFIHEQAQRWAERLLEMPQGSRTDRISQAYYMAFGRAPEPWETNAASLFLSQSNEQDQAASPLHMWTDLCHTLLNVKEFMFY